ncbi:MAG: PQQ-binding-like beta-propeller repeat protein [Planctomycetales bacterium]
MAWRRYLVYALIIAVSVGLGLFIFSLEQPESRTAGRDPNRAYIPAATPSKPWASSPETQKEADAGFSVDLKDSSAKPLAGQKVGADWSQFNGSNRDNLSTETGLLKKWPTSGPKLLWIAKGTGEGYSTVAVKEGVLYTLGNKGSSETIMALDVGTGKKLWCTPYAAATHPSVGNGPRGTPAVDENSAYGLGANGDLVAVDRKTGKIRWQKNILTEFQGNNIGWGISESVLLDGDRLICTPGGVKGTVVTLNKETGKTIWAGITPEKDPAGYASALVTQAGGVRQYIQFTAYGVIGLAAEDGKFLWRDDHASNTSANCSSPLVSGDVVFYASSYGTGGALVRLKNDGPKVTATLAYQTKDMKSHHGDMVIHDGLIFGSNEDVFTCLELQTGKSRWKNRSVGKGAVTYADGCIYLRAENGTVALIEATGAGYRELGKFDQPNRGPQSAWAHPVVAAKRLFLRDQDVLLCYDLAAAQ